MNLIDTGIEKGLIRFDEDKNFITYIHQNKKRNYNNPEEKVQADKSAVQTAFTDKVNLFKEELTEKYFLAKQIALDD